jgi:hypothetical protein
VEWVQWAAAVSDVSVMDRYTTTTALPFAHLVRATSALRAELRRIIDADGWAAADWSTLRVVGPVETFGPRGVVHYEYRGSVRPRRLSALPNRALRDHAEI